MRRHIAIKDPEEAENEMILRLTVLQSNDIRSLLPADVYHVGKPLEYRLVTKDVLTAAQISKLQDLLQKIVGGQVFVKVARSADDFVDSADRESRGIIYVGSNSTEILRAAARLSAGVVLVDGGLSAKDAAAALAPLAFGGFIQRLDKLILQVIKMWEQLTADPTVELTPEVFNRLKSVPVGATPGQYKNLLVRVTKIAWERAMAIADKTARWIKSSA